MVTLNQFYHPATGQLLRHQSRQRVRKWLGCLVNPRRRWLAITAIVLGVFWVFQAIASIFLRAPADPERLAIWLPTALLMYAGWHLIRLASQGQHDPYEWSESETEWILAAPLSQTQRITYRMISIFKAATAKALCFSILMIPDLHWVPAGFVGMLLGLLWVDLLRLTFHITFQGCSPRAAWTFRVVVLTTAVIVGGSILLQAILAACNANTPQVPLGILVLKHLLKTTMAWAQAIPGKWVLLPFTVFTEIALAESMNTLWWTRLLVVLAMTGGCFALVYRLDHWMIHRSRELEQQKLANRPVSNNGEVSSAGKRPLRPRRVPPRVGGWGGIAWRQWRGACNYQGMLLLSLAVPAILSCLPLLTRQDPPHMLFHLVASMIFYSFLLLPSALMLDFRRDLGRMALLKSLPISPLALTLGQLSVPVVICSAFQALVLCIAWSQGAVEFVPTFLAWLMLIPVNVIIFALENLMFLVSPYQRNREGVDVFLRTILTFTVKGLLFVCSMVMTIVCALLIKKVVGLVGGSAELGNGLFMFGICLLTIGAAAALVEAIRRQFVAFDPSSQ